MRKKLAKVLVVILSLILIVIVVPIVVSCLRWPAGEGTFEGTYTYEFEVSDFQPDMSLQHWHLDIEPNQLRPITEACWGHGNEIADGVAGCRLKVRGKLSARGNYGHMGMARRKLDVSEVLDYEVINKKEQMNSNKRINFDSLSARELSATLAQIDN